MLKLFLDVFFEYKKNICVSYECLRDVQEELYLTLSEKKFSFDQCKHEFIISMALLYLISSKDSFYSVYNSVVNDCYKICKRYEYAIFASLAYINSFRFSKNTNVSLEILIKQFLFDLRSFFFNFKQTYKSQLETTCLNFINKADEFFENLKYKKIKKNGLNFSIDDLNFLKKSFEIFLQFGGKDEEKKF